MITKRISGPTVQLPTTPRSVKASREAAPVPMAAPPEASVISAPVETAIERDVMPSIEPTRRDEQLAAAEFAQDAPPLKPVLATLAEGSYPLKGGWRLTIAKDALELKPGKEAGARLTSGVVELESGSQRLLLAIVALTSEPDEQEQIVAEPASVTAGPAEAEGLPNSPEAP